MVIGILTRLAGFSVKNPRTILFIVLGLAIVGLGIHYKLLVGERDKLRVAEEGYKVAVAAFVKREATLQEDLRLANEAVVIVAAERDAQRATLDQFRAGRDSDPESQAWSALPIPIGELERLCLALPEMDGCE